MRRVFSAGLIGLLCSASVLLPAALCAQPVTPATHTVQQGDTLWGLAQRYFGRPLLWPDIQQRNNVVEPRLLQIGRVLEFADSERLALVLAANGDVHATYEAASGLLRKDMRLPEGALIKTGADSFVTLLLPDGSRATLPSNSTVRLLQFFDAGGRPAVLLDLQAGDVESRVPPRAALQALPLAQDVFRVRTRMATVGVRGTHFRVSLPAPDRTAVSVLESTVSVDTGVGEPSLVHAKKGLLIEAQHSPDAVRDLLAAPVWIDAGKPQNQPGVVLAWGPVESAAGYRVDLARDSEFADLVAQQSVAATGDRALAVFDGVAPGSYFARVAGVTREGLEGLTAIDSFSRAQAALFGTAQRRDGSGGANEIEFEWASLNDSTYLLEVADDVDFKHAQVHADQLQSHRVRVEALPPGAYFWRVRASVISQGQRTEVVGPTLQLRIDGVR
ncbi:hypothetical protein BH11PSE13_BH11PSE13_08750 [soil metagenome]